MVIDDYMKKLAQQSGINPLPGETEEELRARVAAMLSERGRGTIAYIDIVASALINVEKPAHASTDHVKYELATRWLKAQKPKKFFERLGWWMNLIWRLL